MCYAILRVSYRNGTEPTTLREVATAEELTKILEELTNRDGVKKVTSFFPYMSRELISEWKDSYHEKSNKDPLPGTEPFPTAAEVLTYTRYKQEHLG